MCEECKKAADELYAKEDEFGKLFITKISPIEKLLEDVRTKERKVYTANLEPYRKKLESITKNCIDSDVNVNARNSLLNLYRIGKISKEELSALEDKLKIGKILD